MLENDLAATLHDTPSLRRLFESPIAQAMVLLQAYDQVGDAEAVITARVDLLLDPARLLPDPRISGRLTEVRVDGGRLVEGFGASPAAGPHGDAKNYMHYRGNTLRFARLTMTDTDMRLIDADPHDAFEFSAREYLKQLVPGYSKNQTDGSLRVYMPDLDDVERPGARAAR